MARERKVWRSMNDSDQDAGQNTHATWPTDHISPRHKIPMGVLFRAPGGEVLMGVKCNRSQQKSESQDQQCDPAHYSSDIRTTSLCVENIRVDSIRSDRVRQNAQQQSPICSNLRSGQDLPPDKSLAQAGDSEGQISAGSIHAESLHVQPITCCAIISSSIRSLEL